MKQSIPILNIPKVDPGILDAASKGKLVVFIGAGVSRIIGCPSWDELACSSLQFLYEKAELSYREYIELKRYDARKILSICRKICEQKGINQAECFKLEPDPEKSKKYKDIYKDLYNFNSIYVTTNYDYFLDQRALATKTESKGKVFYKRADLLVHNLQKGNVLHIHGSMTDPESMVVTIVDYMKAYGKKEDDNETELKVFLSEIFENYTVLFIGYGLEEYEILEFMINKHMVQKGEIRHFMLYPFFKEDKNILEYITNYYYDLGIKLIPYNIGKRGFDQLAYIIKKWSKQIGSEARPQNFYDKVRLIDEVVT